MAKKHGRCVSCAAHLREIDRLHELLQAAARGTGHESVRVEVDLGGKAAQILVLTTAEPAALEYRIARRLIWLLLSVGLITGDAAAGGLEKLDEDLGDEVANAGAPAGTDPGGET